MAARRMAGRGAPNLRPLSKSEAWMFDKVEAAAMRKMAEERAKLVRTYARRLAERRRITHPQALRLLVEYQTKRADVEAFADTFVSAA